MKLQPNSVKAEYINRTEDYTVIHLMGSPVLVYGTPKKKICKGVAFKDVAMMREVATMMLLAAEAMDKKGKSHD